MDVPSLPQASEVTVQVADRADRAVARALGLSTAAGRRLIEEGRVRLGGRRLKKGEILPAGALLAVARATADELVPEPGQSLAVLLETPAFVVVDKPAGWPCFPLHPGETGTVANAVVAQFPECREAGAVTREAGLCHRLDRETSGALLIARTRAAFEDLRRQFTLRRIEKRYLALVRGLPPERGEIDLPLTSDRVAPRSAGAFDRRPRPAVSRYWRRWAGAEFAVLEVQIETGVRYQIRAHLAALGTPLAGDSRYGGGAPVAPLTHQLLHAHGLGFEDPLSGAPRFALAPLPALALAALRGLGMEDSAIDDLDAIQPPREDAPPR